MRHCEFLTTEDVDDHVAYLMVSVCGSTDVDVDVLDDDLFDMIDRFIDTFATASGDWANPPFTMLQIDP